MKKLVERFERIISGILLVFAMLIIIYQVVQLMWNTFESFSERFTKTGLEYAPEYGKVMAILFFNILLMMEIMQTIKVFAHNHMVKVRVILIVCLIAVSRKILAMGEKPMEPLSELSVAALILSLSAGYFLVSRYSKDPIEPGSDEKENK